MKIDLLTFVPININQNEAMDTFKENAISKLIHCITPTEKRIMRRAIIDLRDSAKKHNSKQMLIKLPSAEGHRDPDTAQRSEYLSV